MYGIPREGGTFHEYNVVDGCVFDLASEQFGDEVLVTVADIIKDAVEGRGVAGRIGGDESDLPSEDLKGLHQATNSMKDYFYLCELAAGESGRIIVRIGLDGESQPNSYKGTSGAVNVRFAVEDEAVTTPSTGDGSRMGLYIGIFSAALLIGVADIGYLIYSKKKEQAE